MKRDVPADEIRRYLLGDLPEDTEVLLEREYFADPDLLARMELVEADLVDEYVTDRLSPQAREQFERHHLGTPDHREELALARSLRAASRQREEARSGSAATETGRRGTRGVVRWLAVAAVGILAVGVAWRVNRGPVSSSTSGFTRAPDRGSSEHPNDVAVPPPGNAAATPSQPQDMVMATLVLSTEATRSDGQPVAVLSVPTQATHVELQFHVDRPIGARRAELASVDAGVVWKGSILSAGQVGAEVNARVVIARQLLPRGDYVLSILAPGTSEASVPERYYFRVRDSSSPPAY